MSVRTIALSVICMAALSVGSAHAQAPGSQRPGSAPGALPSQPQMPPVEPGGAPRHEVAPEKAAPASQTSHTIRLDGREIKYTATAGTLPIRLDDGKVAAQMFFVAYTKDGEDRKTRPVSFLYNGGPGLGLGLAAHGVVRAAPRPDGRRRLPAGAALPARGQRELAARRDRPRVRGCHRHRLQPRRRRGQQPAVPRPGGRPPGIRRVHRRLPRAPTTGGRRRSSSSARATGRSGRPASRRSCRRATASS